MYALMLHRARADSRQPGWLHRLQAEDHSKESKAGRKIAQWVEEARFSAEQPQCSLVHRRGHPGNQTSPPHQARYGILQRRIKGL